MDQYPKGLLSVTQAQERLLRSFSRLESVQVPLSEAMGRVLAETIFSSLDLPPFDNSSMDGFAVRVADLSQAAPDHPVVLTVVADIPAGQVIEQALAPGQAIRIMTGAPVPPGAEAVIPVEDTDFQARSPGLPAPEKVKVFRRVIAGENVRPHGQDVRLGEAVVEEGKRLRTQDLGFLAMLGISSVPVVRKPRVAVFSTGDELVPPEAPLQPGKIHDSNTTTLVAAIEAAGGEAISLGIIPDREDEVKACLEQAAALQVDLILSSAGVSVGAFDFVRSVVEQHGGLDFWRVNMRPGKPLAFGSYRGIPFVGLPGNPVSAFVGFVVFVRPALVTLAGEKSWKLPLLRARLAAPVDSDGRESYLRAIVSYHEGQILASLTGHQGSGNLRSLVQANALLIIPSGVKSLPSGAEVDVWLMN